MEKVCNKCGVLKSVGEFNKTRSDCKVCQREAYERRTHIVHPGRKPRETYATADARRIAKNEAARRWNDRNPEKYRAIRRTNKANRKVKLRGNVGRHTYKQVQELHARQKYRCAVCKCDTSKERHVDHIVPLAAGGTNYIENLQILCPACNMEKSAKDPVLFMQSKGFLL